MKESFMTFTKRVNDLIEDCSKTEDCTVKLEQEITEMGQQIILIGERMSETKPTHD